MGGVRVGGAAPLPPAADGWWSAVRHIGSVFGLNPNEDSFDSFGLPYPDLSVTISQIRMEPAANMWEHFNTPGRGASLRKRDNNVCGCHNGVGCLAVQMVLMVLMVLDPMSLVGSRTGCSGLP